MRTWMPTIFLLLSAIVCYGERAVLGQTLAGVDPAKAKNDVENYYSNNAILKRFDKESNTWVDLTEKDLAKYKDTPTYVISHGLNSSFDSDWINDSAQAIQDKYSGALIVSVNWDHFSGTSDDKNFAASTWINSVTPVLASELGELTNIKSFVGHSYGTHLLAATMVEMRKDGNLQESKISFVALDPAEETLTFTGDKKDGSPTWMGSSDKKSKDWGLPENVTTETYKSSGFLGSEERLGDYNYFLAAKGSITPRGVLGDLDYGLTANHSVAPVWFAEMMDNKNFGGDSYNESQLIGGWFNSETDQSRGNRPSSYWDGVVNADTSPTNPKLEYSAREDQKFTEWQDLCNAEAQELLHHDLQGNEKDDKSNWDGTVLKPSKYSGYKLVHGNDTPQTSTDAKGDRNNENVSNTRSTTQNDGGNVSDGDAPANILNTTFADDPAEPKDAQTLANEAFDKEIDKIVKDIADRDESLAQKIKDYVKGKIDEAIKKGEDWIENGGIRKTILEQLDKMLEGKVSSEDAQRIHNLVDTLCNVNKDGGESFCNTLGTDGKDLAVSLAVEALKKQLSDALPEDAADMVNAMLDVLKDKGTADDYKKAVLGQIQDLIAKYVPYENTANTLNNIIQNISDGNAIDVMDSIKDVGKNLGVDLLKDTISKNLDPELANRINALLDGFAKDGIQGVTDEALSQIYGLIDKYAPGADSAQKLKDIIRGVIDGMVTAPDFGKVSTSIVTDGVKKLINDSNLPQGVKDVANAAIDGLSENGITGMTENVGDFIQDYVTDQLGEEAGDAVREIYDAIVTPGEDAWETVVKNAPTIGQAIGQKVLKWVEGKIATQIDKLIAKYPALKNILDKLGINGKGIVQGVKNVLGVLWNAPSLKDALTQLSKMAVNFLKDIAKKLIDMAVEYAINWITSQLVPKVVNWATQTLQKWADSVSNPLLKKGLEWLAGQVSNCKKCASIKVNAKGTGEKVFNWIDSIRKGGKSGETVLESK